jgi:hypothetical protein
MSKNTDISELINYVSVNGSGHVVFTTVPSAASNTDKFLVSDSGVLKFRTAAQLLSDIGAQASGSYQAALSGTGFIKISGTTISYDNSTYATETYVGTAISNLVASSPATLDTLNELALALGSDPNFATTVATSIGTKQPQLNGTGFVKVTGTTVSYDSSTYLTSASLTGYIPYTGASQAVNLGYNQLLASTLSINGESLTGGSYLGFKHSTSVNTGNNGYTSIYTFGTNTIGFKSISGATTKDFSFSMASITPGVPGGRIYTLPDADGTLALTSNLSSYVIGSGTATYLPIWNTGGTSLGNSKISQPDSNNIVLNHGDTYSQGLKSTYVSVYKSLLKLGRTNTAADSNVDLIYDIEGTEIFEIRRNYANATFSINTARLSFCA